MVFINPKIHFKSYSNMKSDFQNLQQLCWISAYLKNVLWYSIFFVLNLEKESFPRYGICAESQPTIIRFILGNFQQKVMTQFCAKVQKPYFWALFPHFSENESFPEKSALSLLSLYEPLTSCKISKKLMSQFQEKSITDARTDRPEFIGPIRLRTGGPKSMCTRYSIYPRCHYGWAPRG